jgi:hypothetical protein
MSQTLDIISRNLIIYLKAIFRYTCYWGIRTRTFSFGAACLETYILNINKIKRRKNYPCPKSNLEPERNLQLTEMTFYY